MKRGDVEFADRYITLRIGGRLVKVAIDEIKTFAHEIRHEPIYTLGVDGPVERLPRSETIEMRIRGRVIRLAEDAVPEPMAESPTIAVPTDTFIAKTRKPVSDPYGTYRYEMKAEHKKPARKRKPKFTRLRE